MDDIAQQLIDESMRKVAGVGGQAAEPHDKIIVVFYALWGNGKSKRARAAEAAIPLGGAGVVGGVLIALATVFGVA